MTLLFRQNRIYQENDSYKETERTSWLVLSVIALLIIAILTMVAVLAGTFKSSEPVPSAPLLSTTRWLPRENDEIFSFSGPEFGTTSSSIAERLSPGRTLRDTLVIGDDKKFIRLVILRQSTISPAGFYLEMVRRSADIGLALLRSGQPQVTTTRFGRTEMAEIAISGPQGALSCLGIRALDHLPAFQISGLICGANMTIKSEKTACLMDSLALNHDGDSHLAEIFSDKNFNTACKKNQNIPVFLSSSALTPPNTTKAKKK